METATCWIERLPVELLAAVISLTSPPDACRAAAVSRAFRDAADSDAVWSRFLPRDLPQLAEGELLRTLPSKKALFRRLSDEPALLPCKHVSMRLDRANGAKCYTLSVRALHISWGDTPKYWTWIDLSFDEIIQRNKSFKEGAKLLGVWWLEISGKIHSMMLSRNTRYTVYMVFKLACNEVCNLDFPFQEASLSIGGSDSTHQVCLQSCMEIGDDRVPQKHVISSIWEISFSRRRETLPLTDDIMIPRKRADGWMEVELGEFYNEEGYDDEVSFSLTETKGGDWKSGLVVWAIEIRPRQ